ncbi:MAG: hypothetical protein R3F14_21415 [Polyangiaceae bacterium]
MERSSRLSLLAAAALFAVIGVSLTEAIRSLVTELWSDPAGWEFVLCTLAGALVAKLAVDRLARDDRAFGLRAGTSLATIALAYGLFVNLRGAIADGLHLAPWTAPPWRVTPVLTSTWPLFVAVLVIVGAAPSQKMGAKGRLVSCTYRAALAATCVVVLACGLAPEKAHAGPVLRYSSALARTETSIPAPGEPRSNLPARSGVTYLPGQRGDRSVRTGDLTVVRVCEEHGCRLALSSEGDPPIVMSKWDTAQPMQYWPHALRVAGDPAGKRVYLAMDGDLTVYSRVWDRWVLGGLDPADLAAETAPPARWFWLGVAGLLAIAAAHLLRARASSAHARMLARARAATLDADGRIAFEDGAHAKLGGPPPGASGPVIVLGSSPGTPYREPEAVRPEDVIPGSMAEHLQTGILDSLRRDLAILAIAAATGAPLLAAASCGLLGFDVPPGWIPRVLTGPTTGPHAPAATSPPATAEP